MAVKRDSISSIQGLKRIICLSQIKGGFRPFNFLPQTNYYYFEASISPIKYSTFQLLGHLTIISLFGTLPLELPASASTSAKMGILGGSILTIYYLLHLCICNTWFYEGRPVEPPSTYVVMFAQEVLHSGIAAVLGAAIVGFSTPLQLASMAVIGMLGPLALVTILLATLVGSLIILWSVKCITATWFSY